MRLPDMPALLADGQSRRWLRDEQRTADAAGPLGGERGISRPSRWRSRSPRLLGAAEIAQVLEIDETADLFRDTADAWNEQIEDWVYVEGRRPRQARLASRAITSASRP